MKMVNKLSGDTLDTYAGSNAIILTGDNISIHIHCSLFCPSDLGLNASMIDTEECMSLGWCDKCFNNAIKDITGVQIILTNNFTGVQTYIHKE